MSVDASGLKALGFAVRHLNVSFRDAVTVEDLLIALTSDTPSPGLETHLRAFYDETDVEVLSDIARSGLIGYDRLAAGARRLLQPGHETRIWLDERA